MFPRMRNGGFRIDARPEEGFAGLRPRARPGAAARRVRHGLRGPHADAGADLRRRGAGAGRRDVPRAERLDARGVAGPGRRACWARSARRTSTPTSPSPRSSASRATTASCRSCCRARWSRGSATAATGRSCAPRPRPGCPSRCTPAATRCTEGRGLAVVLPRDARLERQHDGDADAVDDLRRASSRRSPGLQIVAVETGIAWAAALSWSIDDAWRTVRRGRDDRLSAAAVGVPARALVVHDPADRGARRPRAPRARVRRARHGRPDPVLQRLPALGLRRARRRRSRARSPRRTRRRSSPATPAGSTGCRADDASATAGASTSTSTSRRRPSSRCSRTWSPTGPTTSPTPSCGCRRR